MEFLRGKAGMASLVADACEENDINVAVDGEDQDERVIAYVNSVTATQIPQFTCGIVVQVSDDVLATAERLMHKKGPSEDWELAVATSVPQLGGFYWKMESHPVDNSPIFKKKGEGNGQCDSDEQVGFVNC